jgi:hypothetical protein
MEFYKVIAKCGHVGKNRYYRGEFFVRAESGKAAAAIVRFLPRVKHHHKDAILDVASLTYEEYLFGKNEQLNNPYFNCRNGQEQQSFFDEIGGCVFSEKEKVDYGYGRRADRQTRQEILRKLFRKADKYGACRIA